MRKDPELAQWLGYNQQTSNHAQFGAFGSEKYRKGTKRKSDSNEEVVTESVPTTSSDVNCVLMTPSEPQSYNQPIEATHIEQIQPSTYSGTSYPPGYVIPTTQYY